MTKPTKSELDSQEEDMEASIEAELEEMGDMFIAYGCIPGYSPFGFPHDEDYASYLGPSISRPVTNEADVASSPEDWKEFLRKVEEDLLK